MIILKFPETFDFITQKDIENVSQNLQIDYIL